MELAKLLWTKLKNLFLYRTLLFVSVFHLIFAFITVSNYERLEKVDSSGFIKNVEINDESEYMKYYVSDVIIYSKNTYQVGSKVFFSGICSDTQNRNFTDFDYDRYLKSTNVSCTLFEPNIVTTNSTNKYYSIKYNVSKIVSETDNYGLKQALVLGNKSNLSNDIKLLFYDLNLAHLLALSGLHISVIVIYINLILRKFIKTKEYIKIFEVVTVTIYSLILFMSYSILRTLLVYYIFFILKILDVKLTKFTVLLIAMNILLLNNYVVFSYSFIYSFLSYAVIVLCLDYKLSFYKLFLILVLFTLPITINMNNQINLTGLLFSPFITIIFELIYFPYIIISTLTNTFDVFSTVFISILTKLNSYKLLIIIKDLSPIIIVVYYAILLHLVKKKNRKRVGYVLLAISVMLFSYNYKPKAIQAMFFDVGQGDAMLFILDDSTTILIDGGGNIFDDKKSQDIAKYTIIPYLKENGISKLDYIISSHGDVDHIGSFEYLVNNFEYQNIYINCNQVNDLEKQLGGDILTNLTIENTNYKFNFSCTNNGSENDSSIVTKARLFDTSFIALGDMSSEFELLNVEKSDILKVSHHGSKNSSDASVINVVDPKYSIISVGKNNYGHPSSQTLENLRASEIFRIDKSCAVKFTINQTVDVKTKCK